MADRPTRAFWIHQLVEYIIGVGLIAQGLQDPRPTVPVVAGLIVVLNVSLVHGPLGAFRFVKPSVHRWLDLVVFALVACAAAQPWVAAEPLTRILMAGALIPLIVVWRYTNFADPKLRAAVPPKQPQQPAPQQAGSKRRVDGASMSKTAGRTAGAAWLAGRRTWQRHQQRTKSHDDS